MMRTPRFLRTALAILLFGLFLVPPVPAASPVDEDTVKAVMVERFARFVEWPEGSDVSDPAKPFVICVFGKSSFGVVMERVYSHRTILGKNVVVLLSAGMGEVDDSCDLLYYASENRAALSDLLAKIHEKPVLFMGDGPSFAEKGGHIGLYFEEGNIRFDVNVQAMWKSKLKVSHLLLKHARIVENIKK